MAVIMADIFKLFDKIRKKEDVPSAGAPEFIVTGLGNPGDKYAHTRHNAGFMALDYIYEKFGISGEKQRFRALCRDGSVAGIRAVFLKPQTFMNLSGDSVAEAADFYKIPPERIIVISDDVNLAVGRVRIRPKGSSGGQKGLESIILRLNSDSFPRIRIGVGTPPRGYPMPDYVLGRIPEDEREDFFFALGNACEALQLIFTDGTETAMSLCNGRAPEKASAEKDSGQP